MASDTKTSTEIDEGLFLTGVVETGYYRTIKNIIILQFIIQLQRLYVSACMHVYTSTSLTYTLCLQ